MNAAICIATIVCAILMGIPTADGMLNNKQKTLVAILLWLPVVLYVLYKL